VTVNELLGLAYGGLIIRATQVLDAAWQLAMTAPTTLAGVAAILRFANQHEDEGFEWPDTDRMGREGWHYQLPPRE